MDIWHEKLCEVHKEGAGRGKVRYHCDKIKVFIEAEYKFYAYLTLN